MSGKLIDSKHAAITAATSTGYISIASTTGWYKGATAYLNAAGQDNVEVTITEIVSATQMGVRLNTDPRGSSTAMSRPAPNYGRSDLSAYNGGTVDQPAQLIYNPNESPLT